MQGDEGQQVYIQIDSSQMGLLQQMEAVGAGDGQDEANDGMEADARNVQQVVTPTLGKRIRRRSRKLLDQTQDV